jgi:hypothetical protein
MNINKLKNELDAYNNGTTIRSWIMRSNMMVYDNDYISVVRIDSSNKWVLQNQMIKMWSIIFKQKKDFTHLSNYQQLSRLMNVAITPVTKGTNKDCFGLRIYGMKHEPDTEIIKNILDFIFDN